jgi:hypothetical protein
MPGVCSASAEHTSTNLPRLLDQSTLGEPCERVAVFRERHADWFGTTAFRVISKDPFQQARSLSPQGYTPRQRIRGVNRVPGPTEIHVGQPQGADRAAWAVLKNDSEYGYFIQAGGPKGHPAAPRSQQIIAVPCNRTSHSSHFPSRRAGPTPRAYR